jgi:uncharacterized protein YjiS (DUF1127 family)
MLTTTFAANPMPTDMRTRPSTTAVDGVAADATTIASGVGLAEFSIASMLAWYRERLKAQRHRRELARLTDEQLWDIGLSRIARDHEVSRSFWE